eukprot:scaffold4562_cov255-Pinguiococcus_pyrenoidosus.AAC.18
MNGAPARKERGRVLRHLAGVRDRLGSGQNHGRRLRGFRGSCQSGKLGLLLELRQSLLSLGHELPQVLRLPAGVPEVFDVVLRSHRIRRERFCVNGMLQLQKSRQAQHIQLAVVLAGDPGKAAAIGEADVGNTEWLHGTVRAAQRPPVMERAATV